MDAKDPLKYFENVSKPFTMQFRRPKPNATASEPPTTPQADQRSTKGPLLSAQHVPPRSVPISEAQRRNYAQGILKLSRSGPPARAAGNKHRLQRPKPLLQNPHLQTPPSPRMPLPCFDTDVVQNGEHDTIDDDAFTNKSWDAEKLDKVYAEMRSHAVRLREHGLAIQTLQDKMALVLREPVPNEQDARRRRYGMSNFSPPPPRSPRQTTPLKPFT